MAHPLSQIEPGGVACGLRMPRPPVAGARAVHRHDAADSMRE
jgi:hypothetical protein